MEEARSRRERATEVGKRGSGEVSVKGSEEDTGKVSKRRRKALKYGGSKAEEGESEGSGKAWKRRVSVQGSKEDTGKVSKRRKALKYGGSKVEE